MVERLISDDRTGFAVALTNRDIAIRICREISRAERGERLQWAFLQSIEESLDLGENAIQVAARYGAEQGWLLLEGEPIHSVILCDAAAAVIDTDRL